MTKKQLEYKNAKILINNFCKFNNIIKPTYRFNNNIKDYGHYYAREGNREIVINLDKCKLSNITKNSACVTDTTITGVLIHEFAHYIHYTYYYDILLKSFKRYKEPLIHFREMDIDEDIAESIRLFITNPTLLQEGRPKRFKILSKYFKSLVTTHYTGLIKTNDFIINWLNGDC